MSRGLSINQRAVLAHMKEHGFTDAENRITVREIAAVLGRFFTANPEYAHLGGRGAVGSRSSIYRMMESLYKRGHVSALRRSVHWKPRGWYLIK